MIGIFRVIQGWIKVKGGSDGTFIGNDGDSLKTNVTASALPSGASTEAKQDTGNASLSSIDSKLTDNATATNQTTLNTRVGATNETAPTTDTGASGLNGRLQRIAQRITSLITSITNGTQKTQLVSDLGLTIESTATGEIYASNRVIEVEAKFPYNVSAITNNITTANGGTAATSNGIGVVSTTTASNGSAQISTKKRISYKSSQDIFSSFSAIFPQVTGTVGTQVGLANSRMQIGIFDSNNGISVGFNNDGRFSVFIKRNGTETVVPATSFSEDDLTGTGDSQYSPDFTKFQLFKINYTWHGIADINFYVLSPANGWIHFHTYRTINTNTVTHTYVPNLPFSFLVENTGNTSNITIGVGSAQISSFGPRTLAGSRFFTEENSATISAEAPIISIRNDSTFQSLANTIESNLDFIALSANGNREVIFRLYKNGTLTGASFANVNTGESVSSVDVAATAITGGELLLPLKVSPTGQYNNSIRELEIFLEPSDVLTITAESAQSNTVTTALRWRELH